MKKKNSKSPSAVGLDVGNHSVKCVELIRTKEKVTLNQAKILPIGTQSPDNLTAILEPFKEIAAGAPGRIRVVLSGSALLCRCVALPLMTQTELKSAIRFEAENHIAFPIDDCILDFQIVNQNPEKKTMNVLLVAAKRDYIQERLKMLLDLDIHPEVIDVDTFCLVNAFEALAPASEEKVYALLNIGHKITSLAVIREKLPLFVRDIPVGGASVTKALAEAKGIPEDQAESLKVTAAPENQEELKTCIQKGLEPLMEEVKRSVEFFENETGEPVKTVWLSGGGAKSAGVSAILAEALGKTVSLWDNLQKLEISPSVDRAFLEKNALQFNVALGMALRN